MANRWDNWQRRTPPSSPREKAAKDEQRAQKKRRSGPRKGTPRPKRKTTTHFLALAPSARERPVLQHEEGKGVSVVQFTSNGTHLTILLDDGDGSNTLRALWPDPLAEKPSAPRPSVTLGTSGRPSGGSGTSGASGASPFATGSRARAISGGGSSDCDSEADVYALRFRALSLCSAQTTHSLTRGSLDLLEA